jgi:hypothetical protein
MTIEDYIFNNCNNPNSVFYSFGSTKTKITLEADWWPTLNEPPLTFYTTSYELDVFDAIQDNLLCHQCHLYQDIFGNQLTYNNTSITFE